MIKTFAVLTVMLSSVFGQTSTAPRTKENLGQQPTQSVTLQEPQKGDTLASVIKAYGQPRERFEKRVRVSRWHTAEYQIVGGKWLLSKDLLMTVHSKKGIVTSVSFRNPNEKNKVTGSDTISEIQNQLVEICIDTFNKPMYLLTVNEWSTLRWCVVNGYY